VVLLCPLPANSLPPLWLTPYVPDQQLLLKYETNIKQKLLQQWLSTKRSTFCSLDLFKSRVSNENVNIYKKQRHIM